MTDSKSKKPDAKTSSTRNKKSQTIRERRDAKSAEKPKRIRQTAGKLGAPVGKLKQVGKKEVHLPLPDNKAGKILKKNVRFMPKFITEAFNEIKLVTWPNRRNTISLTFAVFLFAVIFAGIVGLLDYALGELFKRVIIKN